MTALSEVCAGVPAVLSVAGWLYLRWERGDFWRADQRLPIDVSAQPEWPSVAVVIPARNEAEYIGICLRSLLAQDYPGQFGIVVVDDGSMDDTAAEPKRASDGDRRVLVERGQTLPSGWTGKLWAAQQGVALACERWPETRYLLLTDADIQHHPTNLRRLVVRAQQERRDLVSLMVRLRCRSFWERLLVPAFIFFFQKLYPFTRVNDSARPDAAAAGGCMLVSRHQLKMAGGMAAIRDRLIDDCALAERIKSQGSIWLGLADDTHSLRSYPRLRDFWAMVARTAFTYLGYSSWPLAIMVAAMSILYLVPPMAVLRGIWASDWLVAAMGALAWLIMFSTFQPTLALYRMPPVCGLVLPGAALLYLCMTVDSARRHWQGRGGLWKGRTVERGPRADPRSN